MNLVWPILVQVALALGIGFALAMARVDAVRRGKVKISDIAVDNRAWPERVRKIGNNFANQFEVPVLFYVLSGLAIFLGQDHLPMTVAAWGFVISRYAHMAIHVGGNNVLWRFRAFA